MIVKALSVLGFFFLLDNINASNCPKCGGKPRLRSVCEEYDPTLTRCFGQSLIRPKILQKPQYNLPLYGSSHKGPCFRRTTIVKPAVIPRPIYTYLKPDCKTEVGTNETELAAAAAAAAEMLTQLTNNNLINAPPVNLGPAIDISKAYQKALAGEESAVPADAVSLALTYKMYQDSLNLPKKFCEDGLSYGFRKLPLENTKRAQQCASKVSEANLYSLNGEIVELKPLFEETAGESLSAEAIDELVDLGCDTENDDVNFVRRPSLADLGYTPAKLPKPTFIELPPLPASPSPTAEASDSEVSALESSIVAVPAEASVPPPNAVDSTFISETGLDGESLLDSASLGDLVSPPEAQGDVETPVQPESTEPATVLLPRPLTIEGFKPGNVIYKDVANSEVREGIPVTERNWESQEELVTQISVPAPPCRLHDILEGIRTFSRSRSSGSGSRSSHRKGSDIKKDT